jgi:hypothetical protein
MQPSGHLIHQQGYFQKSPQLIESGVAKSSRTLIARTKAAFENSSLLTQQRFDTAAV